MRRHSKGAGAPPGLAAPSREVAVECDEWEIPSQPHFVLFDRLPRAALASTFVCVALFASTNPAGGFFGVLRPPWFVPAPREAAQRTAPLEKRTQRFVPPSQRKRAEVELQRRLKQRDGSAAPTLRDNEGAGTWIDAGGASRDAAGAGGGGGGAAMSKHPGQAEYVGCFSTEKWFQGRSYLGGSRGASYRLAYRDAVQGGKTYFACARHGLDQGRKRVRRWPTSNRSSLGRFPLVSADFSTSDRPSERSRSMYVVSGTRARGERASKRR